MNQRVKNLRFPFYLSSPSERRALALSALLLLAFLFMPGCMILRGGRRAVARQEVEQGHQLAARGLTDEALAAFEKAIETSPRLAEAYLGAAQIYQVKGDYETAAEAYGKAAQLRPSSFDAHFGQGLMLQLLERFSEAVRAYLRAVQLKPYDGPTNLNLATSYLRLGEARQALPYAERAVSLDPGNGAAHMNLGAVYTELKRYDEALYEYEAALGILGPDPQVLRNLAETQDRLEMYEDMYETLLKLAKIDPGAKTFERLGYACFKTRRYNAALASFESAVRIDPDYVAALNGVGVCLLNQYLMSESKDEKIHQRAIDMLRRSLQLNQNQPQILNLLNLYG
ncbi:MAG TPA: tetratricopeptide repeat protein [Phycisphaeraceae bacterium]|nr:tetratricopeptide repeat protein [Phycisphaeraceae bacterium]